MDATATHDDKKYCQLWNITSGMYYDLLYYHCRFEWYTCATKLQATYLVALIAFLCDLSLSYFWHYISKPVPVE